MMCIYKHCFLPMLLVSAMKCCTKMLCPLPHNHYCCLLPSPICLPHLFICTCLISSPIACPPSSVLCWCLLCFLILVYATFLCDSILACLCTYFLFRFYFCVILHFFFNWLANVFLISWLYCFSIAVHLNVDGVLPLFASWLFIEVFCLFGWVFKFQDSQAYP